MTTARLALTAAAQAIGDGTKQVLIQAEGHPIFWTDTETPDDDTVYHTLAAGDSILLPAGMHIHVTSSQLMTFGFGSLVYTIYP